MELFGLRQVLYSCQVPADYSPSHYLLLPHQPPSRHYLFCLKKHAYLVELRMLERLGSNKGQKKFDIFPLQKYIQLTNHQPHNHTLMAHSWIYCMQTFITYCFLGKTFMPSHSKISAFIATICIMAPYHITQKRKYVYSTYYRCKSLPHLHAYGRKVLILMVFPHKVVLTPQTASAGTGTVWHMLSGAVGLGRGRGGHCFNLHPFPSHVLAKGNF